MHKWIYIIVTVLFVVLVNQHTHAELQYIRLDAPELSNSVVISGDLFDMGRDQLIVGKGSKVDIYLDDEIIQTISGISGSVTALAFGDLTGNFRNELLVGTNNAGAFYIFEKKLDRWQRIGEPRYLWAPVTYLQVADLTADGWGDIIAQNAKGEVQVFLSWQGELYSFYRTQPDESIKQIFAEDLTSDGADEIVFTYNFGYVAVLKWINSELNVIWENYPWGSIDGLMVGSLDNRPEIIVITSQGILYSWIWEHNTFVLKRHFLHSRLGNSFDYVNGSQFVSFSDETGISFFTIGVSQLVEQTNISHLRGQAIYAVNDRLLIRDRMNQYYWLETVDSLYLPMYFDGELHTEPIRYLFRDGQLYLSLSDSADTLDWMIIGQRKLFMTNRVASATLVPDKGTVGWNNIELPLRNPVIIYQEEVFVPLEFFLVMGYDLKFDTSRRRLDFDKTWGWWFDAFSPTS